MACVGPVVKRPEEQSLRAVLKMKKFDSLKTARITSGHILNARGNICPSEGVL